MQKRAVLLLFILFTCFYAWGQCDVRAELETSRGYEIDGDFKKAQGKIEALLTCPNISPSVKAQLITLLAVQVRNQVTHPKRTRDLLLEAKALRDSLREPYTLDFKLLLIENGASKVNEPGFDTIFNEIETEVLNQVPKNHLMLGRYNVILNRKYPEQKMSNYHTALDNYEQLDSIPIFYKGYTLRALGNNYRTLGDLEKSKGFYERELELYLTVYNEDHFDAAICHYNLGNIGYEFLEYQTALDHYLPAHDVWKNVYQPEHFRMKTLNEAIGDMYWELGDKNNALVYFNNATQGETVINNDQSEITINNGNNELESGNYKTAINYYQEAVAWREKTYGKEHLLTAACRSFVARAIGATGDLKTALQEYQKAIGILVPELKNSNWTQNPNETSKIQSYQYLFDALEEKANLLLQLFQQSNDIQHLTVALETQQAAISVLEKIKNSQISETSKIFWNTRARSLFESGIHTSLLLYNSTDNISYLNDAFQLSEKSKALLLRTILHDQKISEFTNIPEAIAVEEKRYKTEISEFQGNLLREQKRCGQAREKLVSLYKLNLQETQDAYDLFQQQIAIEHPKYYQLKFKPTIKTVDSIQNNRLDETTQLVSYFAGDEYLFVFSITKNNITVRQVTNAASIYAKTTSLHALLSNATMSGTPQERYNNFCDQSKTLYNYLLAPELQETTKRLIVIPDGNLAYLPFDILLTDSAPKKRSYTELPYLLKKTAIGYSASASIDMQEQNEFSSNDTYMGFAPNYQGTPPTTERNKLATLQYNNQEITNAEALFSGTIWAGNQASEETLKSEGNKAGILHLALHGAVEDDQPLLSKLYFNASENEDGILHTYEIYNLSLPAQLIVLSACNTASGSLLRGEGILSLERAFQYAGGQSLLSTLWTVDDASSATLTQEFLTRLKNGKPKDIALQEAKLRFIASASPEKTHPFYWSSFKLTGNTSPLQKNNSLAIWALLGGGVLLALLGLYWYKKKTSS